MSEDGEMVQEMCEMTEELQEQLSIERRRSKVLVDALNSIASWGEGKEVSGKFDDPCSAQQAREALKKYEELGKEFK